jgi:HEAT repeat protein
MTRETQREIELINALGDTDWRVRRKAIEAALGETGATSSLATFVQKLRHEHRDASLLNSLLQVLVSIGSPGLPLVIELTRDPDPEVRMYAALALGDLKDPYAISALTALLRDPDVNVRYHAIEALAKLKAVEAVDDLADIAQSGDFFLAFAALDALAAIREPRVTPRLAGLLENDVLQAAVVGALAELGDETMVPSLVALMDRADLVPPVAQALVRLAERYEKLYGEGEHVADLVREHSPAAAAQNMLSMLDSLGGDSLRAVVRVLGWVENEGLTAELTRLLGSSEVRHEVIETLVRHGRDVASLLSAQLEADDLDTRRAAITALARIGDPLTVPALLRALGDPDLTVEAAGALARIGDPRAYEPLLELLGHDRAAVRQAAIAGVNSLGHPNTPSDIKKMLFHSNPHLRESAVRIAGYFGYPDCAGQLLDRIHDVSENVRRAAVENLAHLQDNRILDALLRAAHDESPRIRAAAVQSLGNLDNMKAFPALVRAMSDADAWIRYYAARSLGRTGSPEAIDVLAAAARSDEANQVRIAAADALGSIGGARVVSVLSPLVDADDRDLARAALNALGAVGHPDAMHPIAAVLQSRDASRRLDAVMAMATRRNDDAVAALEAIGAHDPDPKVSEAAMDRLAAMATPASIRSLLGLAADRRVRDRAISALAAVDSAHMDRIGTGLDDPRIDVRRAVVEALSRKKHPMASELLSKALEDQAAPVRLAAVLALRHLGSHAAERKLAGLIRTDPDIAVRRAAEKALER